MAHALGRAHRDESNAEITEAAETLIVHCVLRGLGVDIVSAPSAPCERLAFLHHQVKRLSV
jgi:hypothetical protein